MSVRVEARRTEELPRSTLEDYPNDPRGHSCLVLGYVRGRPVHVVCGLTKQGKVILITVYVPAMPKWKDEHTRNR